LCLQKGLTTSKSSKFWTGHTLIWGSMLWSQFSAIFCDFRRKNN
jgi:hypothetical protein